MVKGMAGSQAVTLRQGADATQIAKRGSFAKRWSSGLISTRIFWLLAIVIPLLFLGVFFLAPTLNLLSRGLSGGFEELTRILTSNRTAILIRNTLLQTALGTGLSVLFGVPIAYLLYRTRFPGRGALQALVMIPFVLPTVVVGVAFRSLLRSGGLLASWNLDQTFTAVLLGLVFFNISVVVRTVGSLWERLDPRQEQAARSLGAGPWRTFATVTLPALAPAIASAAALVALFCITAFGVVLVLGGARYGTIETEIYQRTTTFLDLSGAAVLSIVQLLVIAGVLWFSNWATNRNDAALALTSGRFGLQRWQWRNPADTLAAIVCGIAVIGLIVFPLFGLIARSFQDGAGNWTWVNYRNLNADGALISPITALWNSLRAGALAALIALVIGVLLSLVLSRRPQRRIARRAISGFDAFVMLPLGVSSVTVGFGFLITLTRPVFGVDLRTSGLLIPFAQAVVAVPLVVRTLLPVLRAIDPRMQQAAAVLGASPLRILRTIDLGLAARAIGLAAGFAFATSLGEFGATSFLARPDAPTLPVLIFRLLSRPGQDNYGMALAASVLLGLLTAGVIITFEHLRGLRFESDFGVAR